MSEVQDWLRCSACRATIGTLRARAEISGDLVALQSLVPVGPTISGGQLCVHCVREAVVKFAKLASSHS